MNVLGTRIVALREEKDWSQGQLALYAKVDQGYLSRIERGIRFNVGRGHLEKLAYALDTTIDYLVGIIDDPRPMALARSPSSRTLTQQIGALMAYREMEELFRLLLSFTQDQREDVYRYARFVASQQP